MRSHEGASASPLFWRLAFATALLTLGLIVVGAIVRVTGSGLGCGDDWPLCKGTILPPFDDWQAWIEWSHRLLVVLIGLLGLGMLAAAVLQFRNQNRQVLGVTVLAALLFAAQSGLGRSVVKEELSPTLVAVHLGMAMLLLGSLLTAGILARYRPQSRYPRDWLTAFAYLTAAFSLVTILTGALVRGSGANLACITWPLCNGTAFPQSQLERIHMVHRYGVLALGLMLAALVWYVVRHRGDTAVRILAMLALVAYLAQAATGALFVFSLAGGVWAVAHVGFAATTWASLVALSVIETLNSREQRGTEEWARQSEAFTQ